MNKDVVHELLIELQRGNAQAAGLIFAHVSEPFYWCAKTRYKLSHEDTCDAIQITLRKVIEKRASYNPVVAGGIHWIWPIFRNTVMDILRERQRSISDELIDDIVEDSVKDTDDLIDPEKWAERREIIQSVRRILAQLSETDRKELLRGRGRAGPKRQSLCIAEQHFRELWMAEPHLRELLNEFYC